MIKKSRFSIIFDSERDDIIDIFSESFFVKCFIKILVMIFGRVL